MNTDHLRTIELLLCYMHLMLVYCSLRVRTTAVNRSAAVMDQMGRQIRMGRRSGQVTIDWPIYYKCVGALVLVYSVTMSKVCSQNGMVTKI